MELREDPPDLARRLLSEQRVGVLASRGGRGPHLCLVAFALVWQERTLYLATPRSTRKFANLHADPRASLLVDNRTNDPSDIARAAAVTVEGRVDEVAPDSRQAALDVYLERHPHLSDFAQAPSCALLGLRLEAVEIVQSFQQVSRLSFIP
jgi:nitroimidazol reductase NimA-like FMN-containing flavoprotein (pyridoxamine 5'-phosphate oxidase superfamily)